ncbi:MAG: hypothetical protein ACKV19_10610 [Verrucomicrobiales bacterium]
MSHSLKLCWRSLVGAGCAWTLALVSLCSCQTNEDGTRSSRIFHGADVTISGATTMEVRHAVVDVMTENEFRMASPFGNIMSFEKEGTRNDEWMYGSYGSRPMRQRVTISISLGEKPETIELVASGQVLREYGNMSGEEKGRLFANGALRYGKYLDMIKERVERQVREAEETPRL